MSSFIYRDEGSELVKFMPKNVDGLYELYLLVDYFILEAFVGVIWYGFAYWDRWTKMRKALINQLDIIIHIDYLKGIKMHEIVW